MDHELLLQMAKSAFNENWQAIAGAASGLAARTLWPYAQWALGLPLRPVVGVARWLGTSVPLSPECEAVLEQLSDPNARLLGGNRLQTGKLLLAFTTKGDLIEVALSGADLLRMLTRREKKAVARRAGLLREGLLATEDKLARMAALEALRPPTVHLDEDVVLAYEPTLPMAGWQTKGNGTSKGA